LLYCTNVGPTDGISDTSDPTIKLNPVPDPWAEGVIDVILFCIGGPTYDLRLPTS